MLSIKKKSQSCQLSYKNCHAVQTRIENKAKRLPCCPAKKLGAREKLLICPDN